MEVANDTVQHITRFLYISIYQRPTIWQTKNTIYLMAILINSVLTLGPTKMKSDGFSKIKSANIHVMIMQKV